MIELKVFMAVHGQYSEAIAWLNAEHNSHGVHESSWIMLLPLVVLAVLSVIGGWVGVPKALWGHNEIEHFLDPVFGSAAVEAGSIGLERGLAAVSVLVALLGLGLAYFFYVRKPGTAGAIAERMKPVYGLVSGKFFVDEIYDAIFVTGLLAFAEWGLRGLIDKGIVDGSGKVAAFVVTDFGGAVRKMQSGNIRSYAGWLALGAAAVMFVMIFGRTLWAH